MTDVEHKLVEKARKKYGKIAPVGKKQGLEECFTDDLWGNRVFWFNDRTIGSTHMMREKESSSHREGEKYILNK